MKQIVRAMNWAVVFALVLITAHLAFGQDLQIEKGSTFHGKGLYNVRGNIDNTNDTAAVLTIPGTVALVDTSGGIQTIGVRGRVVVNALIAGGKGTKLMGVPLDVDSALEINNGAGNVLNVNAKTLTLNGVATKTSGALKADSAADSVVYNGVASQAVLDATYGNLSLMNSGAKTLAGPVVAAKIAQTGGGLTVNQNLTVNGTGALAVIDSVETSASMTVKGTASVDSLVTNNGTIAADSGAVTFKSIVTSAGTLASSKGGTLAFQKDIHNNNAFTLTDSAKAQFAGLVNGTGAYTFDSLSVVTYDAATGTQAVLPVPYGSLALKNTNKTTTDSIILKGKLAIDSALTMPSGKAVVMTSPINRNVSGTGEVIGSVRRTAAFLKDSLYTYNSAGVGFALDSAITGAATLTMQPATNLDSAHFTHYAERRYLFNETGLSAAHVSAMSLAYSKTELTTGTLQPKLGIREFNDTSWLKLAKTASYARNVDTNNFVVSLTGIAGSLASITEFGVINTAFGSKQSGQWSLASTWDENSVPGTGDDAEINPTHDVTVTVDTTVASLALLDPTSSLTVTTGSLNVETTLDNAGLVTVGDGVNAKSLTVTSNFTNNKNIVVSPLATLKVNGKLKNFGDITNNGTVDIGQ